MARLAVMYVPSEPGGSGSSGCADTEALRCGGAAATEAREPPAERDARNDPDLPTVGQRMVTQLLVLPGDPTRAPWQIPSTVPTKAETRTGDMSYAQGISLFNRLISAPISNEAETRNRDTYLWFPPERSREPKIHISGFHQSRDESRRCVVRKQFC